jgi:hypothetical protein
VIQRLLPKHVESCVTLFVSMATVCERGWREGDKKGSRQKKVEKGREGCVVRVEGQEGSSETRCRQGKGKERVERKRRRRRERRRERIESCLRADFGVPSQEAGHPPSGKERQTMRGRGREREKERRRRRGGGREREDGRSRRRRSQSE